MGETKLLGARFRYADAANLALVAQPAELADRVLDRNRRVDTVEIIEIDMVYAEPLQARPDGVGRGDPRDVVSVQAVGKLAGDRQPIPVFANGATEKLLVMSRA